LRATVRLKADTTDLSIVESMTRMPLALTAQGQPPRCVNVRSVAAQRYAARGAPSRAGAGSVRTADFASARRCSKKPFQKKPFWKATR
jgi:hypothetical protein